MSTVPKLYLGPHSAGMLMTPEEFDAVEDYDEEYRYELIHGVLVVSPLRVVADVAANEELGRMLRDYRDELVEAGALDATLPERYIRTPDSRRRADRVIWVGLGRTPNPDEDTPNIAVEFVSRAKRDRDRDYVEKKKEYCEAGIGEYWIVDRFQRIMTVFVNDAAGTREIVVREGEVYRTPLSPGFELRLARLLAVADKWGRES